MSTEPFLHREPRDLADRCALDMTRLLRFFADACFAKRYGHRAIVLETVAAVPGMVGAMLTHLHCLRRMAGDEGWIRTLMEEAENERMHLMTFIEIARPTALEQLLILVAQWTFYVAFFLLYLVSRRHAPLADPCPSRRDSLCGERFDAAPRGRRPPEAGHGWPGPGRLTRRT